MQSKKIPKSSLRYRLSDRKYLSSSSDITSICANFLNTACICLILVVIFSKYFMSTSEVEHLANHTKNLNKLLDEHQSYSQLTSIRDSVSAMERLRKNSAHHRKHWTSGIIMSSGSKFYPLPPFKSFPREKVAMLNSRARAIKEIIHKYPVVRSQGMTRKVQNILATSEKTFKSPVTKRKTSEEMNVDPTNVEDIEVSEDEVEAKNKVEEEAETETETENVKTADESPHDKPNVNYHVFDTRRALRSKPKKRQLLKTSFYPPGDPDRLYSDALLVYVKDFTT